MKQLLKRTLLAAAPEWTTGLLSARARAQSHRLVREWGLDATDREVARKSRPRCAVRAIPWNDALPNDAPGAPRSFPARDVRVRTASVDCAESPAGSILRSSMLAVSFGYYAVGLPGSSLVHRWSRSTPTGGPGPRVERWRPRIGPANVEVAGFCSPAWLDRNLRPSSLILCDCEGYEADLLTRSTSGTISSATLIVETHDAINPGVTEAVRKAFCRSRIR